MLILVEENQHMKFMTDAFNKQYPLLNKGC